MAVFLDILSRGPDQTNGFFFFLQANELEIVIAIKYKTINWHNECSILVTELNDYNHNVL